MSKYTLHFKYQAVLHYLLPENQFRLIQIFTIFMNNFNLLIF